jgi:hypothetical protein
MSRIDEYEFGTCIKTTIWDGKAHTIETIDHSTGKKTKFQNVNKLIDAEVSSFAGEDENPNLPIWIRLPDAEIDGMACELYESTAPHGFRRRLYVSRQTGYLRRMERFLEGGRLIGTSDWIIESTVPPEPSVFNLTELDRE